MCLLAQDINAKEGLLTERWHWHASSAVWNSSRRAEGCGAIELLTAENPLTGKAKPRGAVLGPLKLDWRKSGARAWSRSICNASSKRSRGDEWGQCERGKSDKGHPMHTVRSGNRTWLSSARPVEKGPQWGQGVELRLEQCKCTEVPLRRIAEVARDWRSRAE